MPRQLPWLNKGPGAKPQVKTAPKPAKKPRIDSDIGDDFFDGTVLESFRKGKQRAGSPESDDDLPGLPAISPRKRKDTERTSRALSSSPPPANSDMPPPLVEPMHKGLDRFDLRDDEWMMVEDELLQTAKLFTRHLHLAEYEQLKKSIQAKKVVARPVIPNAKPSTELQLQMKARAQAKAQKDAQKEVRKLDVPKRSSSTKLSSNSLRTSSPFGDVSQRSATHPFMARKNSTTSDVSDSDDLDAPERPSQTTQASQTMAQPPSMTFIKPALPPKTSTPGPRRGRATPFDLLDDNTPKRSSSPPKDSQASTTRSSSPAKASQAARRKPPVSRPGAFDLLDELDFGKRDALPKAQNDRVTKRDLKSIEQNDRLAKRRAEKEKEKEREKRKSIKLDDIPTFLF